LTLLAELGDPFNFKSYKSVIAFAGLDTSINESEQTVRPFLKIRVN